MTTAVAASNFSLASFDAFLRSRQEPAWLTELRRQHWHAYEQMNWPQRNDEEWIRTDIRLFKLGQFALPMQGSGAQGAEAVAPLLSPNVTLAGDAGSVDSRPLPTRLAAKWSDRGVLFGSLDQLVNHHGDIIKRHLYRAVDPTYDKFAALNAACWSGGTLLYVPRNVVIDEPLHVLTGLTPGGVDLSRLLIVLEEGAEATVMFETVSPALNDGGLSVNGAEVIVAANARLRLVTLQNWGHGVWNFGHQKALVGRDASLQWTLAAMGSRLSKVNQHVELVGKGAECQVNGVLFAEDKQHISYHTLQHHVASDCRSDFLYKAALQDKARTVWRGMIKVDKSAQKTNGYQRNDNLLLSTNARADSIPGLEIEADDVRCTHGSTSGKVDEELIFYAQTRGFTRKEATRIIVSGFFQQIFDRITIESVRDALGQAIAHRVREYV